MTRYSALEVTNVQLRRQVEQLELLCKEQAAAAQQLTKRQQVRFISFNYQPNPLLHPSLHLHPPLADICKQQPGVGYFTVSSSRLERSGWLGGGGGGGGGG